MLECSLTHPMKSENTIHGNSLVYGRPDDHEHNLDWDLFGALQRTVNLFPSLRRCWNAASHKLIENIIHGNSWVFGRPVNHKHNLVWGLSEALQWVVNLFLNLCSLTHPPGTPITQYKEQELSETSYEEKKYILVTTGLNATGVYTLSDLIYLWVINRCFLKECVKKW